MADKSKQNVTFDSLDIRRQKAVILLFEDELTDEEIAKSVDRSRATLAKWKNNETFKQAQMEYRHKAIDDYVPDAIKRLHKLSMGAKSEMVSLQASTTILSMAGFGGADRNPELEKAKIRKANAEADIKQAQARREADGNNSDGHVSIEIVMPGDDENQD